MDLREGNKMSLSKPVTVPEENQRNAVLYARFSSERQTENSIDFQLRADRAYCEQKGFRVVGEYIDRAISGTTDNRPEFQRMIADAKKQQFAFVVVYRFDRFARNRYDSAIYKKTLERSGVRVLSTEESVGTGDEGIILESIYEAMAESYSRKLSRIVTEGMKQKAIAGLSTGGALPYAYKIVDHRLAIDEDKAPYVRRAFEMYADGKTKSEIAKELNACGCRTQFGNPLNIAFISRMLSNPTYKGENDYCGIKRESPAIVTPELFDKVQTLLQKNKKQYGRKTGGAYFALTGKLFCGTCGAAMIGDSGTGKNGNTHYYYTCINRKNRRTCRKKSEQRDWLEKYVCTQTVDFILAGKNIDFIAQRVSACSEAEAGTAAIRALERQLSGINRELDEAADALIKTRSNSIIKRINEKVEVLEARQLSIEEELAALRLRQDLRVTAKDVTAYLSAFVGGDVNDPEYRRLLINTLVNAVYVWDDKILIYYNISGNREMQYTDACLDTGIIPNTNADTSPDITTDTAANTLIATDSEITNPPPTVSDSLSNGSPLHQLSEHIRLIFYDDVFGAIISRS